MEPIYRTRVFWLILVVTLYSVNSFSVPRNSCSSSSSLSQTSAGSSAEFPVNEWARPLAPDRILRRQRRDTIKDIEATEAECQALADRFDLSHLSDLSAHLELTPKNRDGTIGVAGSVKASVGQTCVRTNEKFIIPVEFDISCVVRPAQLSSDEGRSSASSTPSTAPQEKRKHVQDMNTLELERLIVMEEESEDDVLEDASIYRPQVLDVGELVAQLFYLELDPYPRKPGSDWVALSITG